MSDLAIESPTDRAKRLGGGPAKLAAELNALTPDRKISPQAISLWARVPPERCLAVEKITGVSRHELRPDVYGPASAEAQP